jgi:drug/metabolite transporter (DMT)-like permease
MACVMLFEGGLDLRRADLEGLLATALVGVVSGGFAYGLWFTIVREMPAATATLGVLSVPVIGVVASMIILGERPSVADIVGFALIFAASARVLLSPRSPAEATSQAA